MSKQDKVEIVISSQDPIQPQEFNWDDEEQALTEAKAKPSVKKASWLSGLNPKNWPSWLRYITIRTIVFLILILPGFIDWLRTFSSGTLPYGDFLRNGSVDLGGYSLMFWSLFAISAYAVLLICRVLIAIVPFCVRMVVKQFNLPTSKYFDIHLDHVYFLKGHIAIVLFLVLLLITCDVLFNPDMSQSQEWQTVMMNIISSLLIVNFLVLIQKLIVQLIAVRFHRKAYKDRLDQMHFASEVVSKLAFEAKKILREKSKIIQEMHLKKPRQYGYPHARDKTSTEPQSPVGNLNKYYNVPSGDNTEQPIQRTAVTSLLNFKKPLKRSKSAEIQFTRLSSDPSVEDQRTQLTARSIGELTASPSIELVSLDNLANDSTNNIASPPPGQATSMPSSPIPDMLPNERFFSLAKQLRLKTKTNPYDARKAARIIYEGLNQKTMQFMADHGKDIYKKRLDASKHKTREADTLIFEDFSPYFESLSDAQRVMDLFDKDANGSVTRQELKDAVIGIEKEKKGLSNSLRDVGSAVGKLDTLLFILALFIALLCVLLIFGVQLSSFLLTSISLLVAATFIFGNSAKNVFEGIIFLFVTHPYDVGDRVFIDGQNWIVKELGILTTTFTRWDGQVIYSPNSVLATKQIVNVRRSPNMMEIVEIHLDISTPQTKLNALKHRLTEYLHAESREFIPNADLQYIAVENMSKLKLQIFLEHRANWQDGEKRFARHNRFMMNLKNIIHEVGISYTYPVMPVEIQKEV